MFKKNYQIEVDISMLLKLGRDKGFADRLRHTRKLSGPNCATEEKSTQNVSRVLR